MRARTGKDYTSEHDSGLRLVGMGAVRYPAAMLRHLSSLRAASLAVLVALPVAAAFACSSEDNGTPEPEETTDPSDPLGGKADNPSVTGGGLIQANSPFYWADSDYDSFRSALVSAYGWSLPTAIADDHALAQRLQLWVDRLDAAVRAQVKQNTGEELVAPKPRIKVLPTASDFNAWVSGVVGRTGALTSGATTSEAGEVSDLLYLNRAKTSTYSTRSVVTPQWPGKEELQSFWNRPYPQCQLSADLQLKGSSCQMGAKDGEIAILASSPWIHITTDLIAALGEKTVVFVLAHELSHYYRSHMSEAKLDRYEFWYDNEPDRKKRPVPSADAAALKAAYLELTRNPKPIQSAVAGAYSPRLRPFLLKGLAPVLTARAETDFACATARDALGPWVTELVEGIGIPSERTTDFLVFEKALADCAGKLALGSEPGATQISIGEVVLAAMQYAPTGKGVSFYGQEPLAEFLGALDESARKLDAKEAKLLSDLQANRIGLYTTEQEADELGFELSLKVGIKPEEVLDGWIEFSVAVDGQIPEYYREEYNKQNGFDTATCKAALEKSFATTNEQGVSEPMFVPIGQLEESHHGNCYRLFNMWRLQQSRKLVPAEAPSEMQPPWSELQAMAKQLSPAW